MASEVKKLTVKVITPEGVSFTGKADYVSVPGKEGALGILPRHTPLFCVIEQGEVVIRNDKDTQHLSVAGGFVDIGNYHVTILADSALRSEDLDEEKIKQAKKRAEEKLREKLSRQEYIAAEAQLRKTLIDLKVAERKKKRLAP